MCLCSPPPAGLPAVPVLGEVVPHLRRHPGGQQLGSNSCPLHQVTDHSSLLTQLLTLPSSDTQPQSKDPQVPDPRTVKEPGERPTISLAEAQAQIYDSVLLSSPVHT